MRGRSIAIAGVLLASITCPLAAASAQIAGAGQFASANLEPPDFDALNEAGGFAFSANSNEWRSGVSAFDVQIAGIAANGDAQAVTTFTVPFDFDKAELTGEAAGVIAAAVEEAITAGKIRIVVAGDADAVGSRAYNHALSLRRAETVSEEIVRLGGPAAIELAAAVELARAQTELASAQTEAVTPPGPSAEEIWAEMLRQGLTGGEAETEIAQAEEATLPDRTAEEVWAEILRERRNGVSSGTAAALAYNETSQARGADGIGTLGRSFTDPLGPTGPVVQVPRGRAAMFGPLQAANLASDTILAGDYFVNAELAPGFELDFARWRQIPGQEAWNELASRAFGNPVTAATPMRASYAGLGATGAYLGATVSLNDDLSLRFGRAATFSDEPLDLTGALPRDLALQLAAGAHTIESTAVGLDWDITEWSGVSLTAAQTSETGSLLAAAVPGALGSTVGAETLALGISARVGFGDGWVTSVAYSEGVTQLDLSNSAFGAADPLRSRSFGFGVARQGVFGDDALGITISRPLQTYGSTNFASLPVAAVAGRPAGAQNAAQSDIQLGYVTTFLDGALALQTNAGYQLNANGEPGQDGVSLLSRAKIRF